MDYEREFAMRYGRDTEYRKWAKEMPPIAFPPSWQVYVIPPFGGAAVRFLVKKGDAQVSVYADFDDSLGCYGEPYWECRPARDGDTARFDLVDVEGLVAEVRASLAKSNRRTRAKKNPPPETGAG